MKTIIDFRIPLGFHTQMYACTQFAVKASLAGIVKKFSTILVVIFFTLALTAQAYASIDTRIKTNVMNAYKSTLPELKISYKSGTFQKCKIGNSRDAADLLRNLYDADLIEYREEFLMLLMNQANNTIGFIKLSSGGITGTVADPRMIFSSALCAGATSMILSHNHPSGALIPSQQDIALTDKIKKAGQLLEIKLLMIFTF